METLKIGYLKYNTKIIPDCVKQKSDGNFSKCDNIYIKSDKPIEIELIKENVWWGKNIPYIIPSGEHFIPSYFTIADIKILNEKDVEMYTCPDYESNFEILNHYYCMIETIEHWCNPYTKDYIILQSGKHLWHYDSHSDIETSLLRYIIRSFQKDFPWIDYYDCYQFKNKNDYMYSPKLKHKDMYKMRQDKDVTVFLEYWDITYGEDVKVRCNEKKFNHLQNVLKRKYKYILEKPEPNIIKKLKSYENIYQQIAEHNKKLEKFLDDNQAFEFVIVEETPFTLEVYNRLKKESSHSEVPLEKLIPI